MKKILIFLWLSMFLQCQAQKKNSLIIPKIDNSFETFDIEKFNTNAIRGIWEIKSNGNKSFQDFQSPVTEKETTILFHFLK